jgi:hypothetical protein
LPDRDEKTTHLRARTAALRQHDGISCIMFDCQLPVAAEKLIAQAAARIPALKPDRRTSMKPLIALFSAAALALTLAACGDGGKEAAMKAEAAAKEAAVKAEAAAKEAAAKTEAAAKEAAAKAGDAAKDAAQAVGDAAKDAAKATGDAAKAAGDATKDAAKAAGDAAGKAVDAAKEAAKEAPKK